MWKKPITIAHTLRPFQEEDLTPLTLQKELQDHYLAPMIQWLLKQGLPVAMSSQNPYQLADVVVALLEWLELEDKISVNKALQLEVNSILESEVVPFILDSSYMTQSHAGQISWDDHLYDTGKVTTALLMLRKHIGSALGTELNRSITNICTCTLTWFLREALTESKISREADASLAMAVEVFAKIMGFGWSKRRPFVKYKPDLHLTLLLDELLRRTYKRENELRWLGHSEVLPRVAEAEMLLGIDWDQSNKLHTAVLAGIQVSEQHLRSLRYDVGPLIIQELNAYIRACLAPRLSGKQPIGMDDKLILIRLYRFCQEIDSYANGSLYHSLQHTLEFVNCLNGLLRGRWPALDEPMMNIYHSALRQITEEGRVDSLRQELFDHRRREYRLTQRLRKATRYQKWLWTFIVVLLSIIILIPLFSILTSTYANDSQSFWSAFGTVVAILTTIAGAVIAVIWRNPGREQK